MNENNQTQAAPNASQAENGDKNKGRTFTQDEVNQIVSERLARERSKGEPSPLEQKEADLNRREVKLSCREYLSEMNYPGSLLDLFSTDNKEDFQASVEKLKKAFPHIFEPKETGAYSFDGETGVFSTGQEHGIPLRVESDAIARAFAKKG